MFICQYNFFQSHQDFIKEREAQNPSGGPTITQCHMVNKDLKLRYQSLPSPQSALSWDIYINLCSAYCEETREPHYIIFFYIDRYIFFHQFFPLQVIPFATMISGLRAMQTGLAISPSVEFFSHAHLRWVFICSHNVTAGPKVFIFY